MLGTPLGPAPHIPWKAAVDGELQGLLGNGTVLFLLLGANWQRLNAAAQLTQALSGHRVLL